jgi:hypothetical protein
MDRISFVLPSVLQKRGLAQHAQGAHVTHSAKKWFEIKTPHLLPFIGSMKAAETVLHIACTHSIALQECQALSAELIEYLRLECPFGGIKDIRYSRE